MRADGTGSHTYQWDAENRLASVDGVAGQACQTTWTACYTNNALGQRVEKKVGSAYTEILYDGYGDVTAFHDRTTWSQVFIPSVGGRQIMKYQASLTFFLHGNTLGSTQTITETRPGRSFRTPCTTPGASAGLTWERYGTSGLPAWASATRKQPSTRRSSECTPPARAAGSRRTQSAGISRIPSPSTATPTCSIILVAL